MALVASLVYIATAIDPGALARAARAAADDPLGLAVALGAYALAFGLRAALWCRALPGLGFGQSLAAIHVSLAGNHLLPLKLGEPLRVYSAVRRAPVPLGAATASTVLLRAADVLAVVAIAAVLGPGVVEGLVGGAGIPLAAVSAVVLVAAAAWLARAVRRLGPSRGWLALALPGATVAWLLESVLVWTCAGWAGIDLSPRDAALVTAVTIAAQMVAVTPGGVGTYEAAATAALVAVGAEPGAALAAALAAHALKTAYALVAGAVGAVHPSPGLLGRVRLPRERPAPPPPAPEPPGPVVLVLPAHDEEATVAAVVARAPSSVAGREVSVVVVDDGSTDRTLVNATMAGAEVAVMGVNRGLGAAVRRGLAEAVDRGAAAVAFCDADGEYAPEELESMVVPILEGRADYVVGSRFAGRIERMRLHRRLGNRVLTRLLSFVARTRITDGQSGYRALSCAAAADAEIAHDFNYAQVLTLDLLAKGYRYREVPIRYAFREHGRSFVRLLPYLRRVVPAVWRQVNGSVLDDVRREAPPGASPAVVVEGPVAGEAVGRGPGHGEGVVGVVVHEQRLAPQREQGGLGGGPGVEGGHAGPGPGP
ncbi:MAG TPA: lysylphosphatidylglycerol synthase domain-containing protein [Miltoncostaeaceae bacterium]|nr:lysylphosphatidylglycerol synthase domain-containing protein [Miltoncostaeaceae bacterium]